LLSWHVKNGRKNYREKIPLAMQGFKWQREETLLSQPSLGGEGRNGIGKTAPRSWISPDLKAGWFYWPVLRQVLKALGHTLSHWLAAFSSFVRTRLCIKSVPFLPKTKHD
jgi:hypothetical protein